MENESSEETAGAESLMNVNCAEVNEPEGKDSEKEQISSDSSGTTGTLDGNTAETERQSTSQQQSTPAGKDKINILLKPVGDAPILKNKLWAVQSEKQVSQITEFVKKYLKLEKNQNLFFFVNQLFAPAPDQSLRDLYECFGSDGKLVLHYSTTVAWG